MLLCCRCSYTETLYRYLSLVGPFHQNPELNSSSGFQSHLVAIVVPDPEVFVGWAKDRGWPGSYQELCHTPVNPSISDILTAYYGLDSVSSEL